jgi:hypothetical protein
MFKVLVGIIVAFLLSCGVALAQTVHLVGDSISRGYALGSFSDTIVPSHPLYVFRSIWTEANAVLAENGVAVRFVYGNTGMGDSTAPARLAARVASGMIGAKDIVIFEDAGDTSMDPDQYQGELEALIDAVAPAKVYVMTMFDYSPAPLNSQFDTPFVGGSGGGTRTINDAIRAAAAVKGASVIDMNAEMDAFQAYMAGQTLTHDFDSQGIHPFVFSQTLMVGAIFRALGVTPYLRCALSLTTPAHANWQSLQYNAPTNYWGDSWPRIFINQAIFGASPPGCP